MRKLMIGVLMLGAVSSYGQTTPWGYPQHSPNIGRKIICSLDSSAELRKMERAAEEKNKMDCFAKEIEGGLSGANKGQIFCKNGNEILISNVYIRCGVYDLFVASSNFIEMNQWLESTDRNP